MLPFRSWAAALTALLLLSRAAPAAPDEDVTPKRAVEIALEYRAAGRRREAVALLERVLGAVPAGFAPALLALGAMRHEDGAQGAAVPLYARAAALEPRMVGAHNNMGKALRELGRHAESAAAYTAAAALHPADASLAHNLALSLHYSGRHIEAMAEYERLLRRAELEQPGLSAASADEAARHARAQLHFDYAVTLQHGGVVERSGHHYNAAIALNQGFTEAWLNLAGLHHRWGDATDAIRNYRRTLTTPGCNDRLKVMVLNNMGIALSQDGQLAEAVQAHYDARALLTGRRGGGGGGGGGGVSHAEDPDAVTTTDAHLARARKIVCDWEQLGARREQLLADIERDQLSVGRPAALLPFDTLHLPVHPRWSLRVASVYSDTFNHLAHAYAPHASAAARGATWPVADPPLHAPVAGHPTAPRAAAVVARRGGVLRLGYLCYDYNDHPTAHLVEGLFHHHNRSRVVAAAYNYGRDDNSTYRRHIVQECDGFVDLVELSNVHAAARLAADRINILVDMQGHTRGGRPEITAMRPAPIVVNYLIFAGTMGAGYMDYLISDRIQTPGEYASFYRERLLLMPHSYQVNYYLPQWQPRLLPRWADFAAGMRIELGAGGGGSGIMSARAAARVREGLPAGALVFANFNKNDKLEPGVFGEWMALLRRFPAAVLWLLESQASAAFDALVSNLRAEAAARGVLPSRIVFAPRRSKKLHLARHWLADLFLDTHIYGAHSTATDALRGGVPVLTATGRNFAGRVATGLLLSVDAEQQLLVTKSAKSFEGVAVRLARAGHAVLLRVRHRLHAAIARGEPHLFNTAQYTADFERGFELMWEVFKARRRPAHIVLPTRPHARVKGLPPPRHGSWLYNAWVPPAAAVAE